MSQPIRVSNVFIPGGFPNITYISREEHQLEDRVKAAKDYLAKLLVVTGPTKSGKTVLVDRVFSQDNSIWIDGGEINSEDSFWEAVVERCSLFTGVEQQIQDETNFGLSAEVSVEGGILVAKGASAISGQLNHSTQKVTLVNRNISSKITAIHSLKEQLIPLIVDDFHYIDKPIQKAIVRALKSPIMHGLPVVFIAIPNRKYDAVEVEREMTGRVENIEMPIWSPRELSLIAKIGFEALNIQVKPSLIRSLTDAAYGSPFLMQEFCREICRRSDIEEKSNMTQYISDAIVETDVFRNIAEHSGRSMFDKLKRGPRARSDRKQRKLKNGMYTDIYGVVMEALKNIQPGIESVSYDHLRSTIRSILEDDLPQKHEISRVLDKIAEISYTDASSTPVIDWQGDDDVLTITDPFFAFFLKWSE